MASQSSDTAWALDLPLRAMPEVSHELDLIRSAIALLASGDARRITLVGLPLDDGAVREVGSLIGASGMVMRAVRTDAGCDITVEAAG